MPPRARLLAATLLALGFLLPTDPVALAQDASGALASRLARGSRLLEEGEPDRALREFQIAVGLDATCAEAHAGVIRSLLASREKERAVETGRKALQQFPGDPFVLVALGQAELASSNYAAARDAADKALAAESPPATAWRLKADAVSALSPEGSAAGEALLRKGLESRKGDPSLLFELGDFLASWGRPRDALVPLRSAAEAAPGRVDVRIRLGHCLLLEKQPVEARKPLGEALEASPDNARIHSLLGRTYEDSGEPAAAAGCYEKAVKLQPKDPLHHVDYGYALALTGAKDRWRDAEKELRTALKLDDGLVEARLHLGWVLNRQMKFKDALDEYAAILKSHPDHPRALHYTADLLVVMGRANEAEKVLQRLLSLRPRDPEVHRLLATVSMEMGKLEDARKQVDKALEMDPRSSRALLLSGRIQEESEKHEEAEKSYLAAVEADPTFSWPHLYLGELYEIYLDKPDDALKEYKRYLELGGKDDDGEIQRRVEDLGG